MRVVLDINVLLVSIPKKSPYRIIFDSLRKHRFTLLLSNEILTEHEEIIAVKTTPSITRHIVEMLLTLKNVERIDIYFKWNLIEQDLDDNKFSDCAIAGNVDFLISNDRHFDILGQIEFPKISCLSIDEFVELLNS